MTILVLGDRFGALLMPLMALQLALVDQNPFRPCLMSFHISAVRQKSKYPICNHQHCKCLLSYSFMLIYLLINIHEI